MKNQLKLIVLLVLAASFNACSQTIKFAKTETVKINGNCGMCEKTIESAAFVRKTASADWDEAQKTALITFDSTKTTADEVLKRIALAGYDNQNYLAPVEAYNKLPKCCRYQRATNKTVEVSPVTITQPTIAPVEHNHISHGTEAIPPFEEAPVEEAPVEEAAKKAVPAAAAPSKESKHQGTNTDKKAPAAKEPIIHSATHPLIEVFDTYFSLKDELVKSDGSAAAAKAKELYNAIDKVNMNALTHEAHIAWMKYMSKLRKDTELIKNTKETERQREHFVSLSANMYELMKVTKPGYPVYYDNCPMYNKGKGARWLSKEKGIKNPYYGSQMLNCGNNLEILK